MLRNGMSDFEEKMRAARHVRVKPPKRPDVQRAIRHLLARAEAQEDAAAVAATMRKEKEARGDGGRRTVEETSLLLTLTKLLRKAGKLSFDEYAFMAGWIAYAAHDDKLSDGNASKRIVRISAQIDAIERAAGLKVNEYWLSKDGPADWQELQRQYGVESDRLFVRELRTLGLRDLADLYRDD